MPFLTEPEPERGAVLPVMPGISRIVAANPGPMTYYGTNTYLIETPDGVAVLDPGPEGHPEHVQAILRATGGNIALILVSHTHHDHVGAVPELQDATGAPTVGFRVSGLDTFEAGHQAGGWRQRRRHAGVAHAGPCVRSSVLRVAGEGRHAGAVQRRPRDVVVHQRGQPAGRQHGGLLQQPAPIAGPDRRGVPARVMVRNCPIRAPWCARCCIIARCASAPSRTRLAADGAANTFTIMDTIYSQVHPRLRRAAERNVLAHLMKLEAEGKVVRDGELWRAA